jgi:hypothetical protein
MNRCAFTLLSCKKVGFEGLGGHGCPVERKVCCGGVVNEGALRENSRGEEGSP